MIETASFPKDFGVDTIAGMMDMEPLSFNRKRKSSHDEERKAVIEFCNTWKSHDWTLELDGAD